ncbi:ArsR family transcriptional regulator [Dietzia sp. SLG510A3-30A2]|nr:ArsR family transcriptional regulator [Dietzia sp. SLG510A3-30A2]
MTAYLRAVPDIPTPPDRDALDNLDAIARRWLGEEYDLEALHAVVAAAAVEQLDGDPVWLLLVSGSGNAKTETVQTLKDFGALMTSTISSQGALLSGTSRKEQAEDATGGLLRKIGDRGILVIKDVTSILSMSKDARAEVLGALREVYDGSWSRNVGTDGGKTLDWAGRIVLIGAVTTAWDKAHGVIAAMGDRFVLVRMDSTQGRMAAGRRAIGNTGSETEMREALSVAVSDVLEGVTTSGIDVTPEEEDRLLAAANLVTLARTAVEFDYRGDPEYAHDPEMPTRFAKQLTQIVRGAVAIGLSRDEGMRLAIRCARDSMPPLRLAIIDDVSVNPRAATKEVRKRLDKPRTTVDRQLQALHLLGVLTVFEDESMSGGITWRYSLGEGIDPTALHVPEMSVPPQG